MTKSTSHTIATSTTGPYLEFEVVQMADSAAARSAGPRNNLPTDRQIRPPAPLHGRRSRLGDVTLTGLPLSAGQRRGNPLRTRWSRFRSRPPLGRRRRFPRPVATAGSGPRRRRSRRTRR